MGGVIPQEVNLLSVSAQQRMVTSGILTLLSENGGQSAFEGFGGN